MLVDFTFFLRTMSHHQNALNLKAPRFPILSDSKSRLVNCVVGQQARLAQSVERETLNLNVVGSSPTLGTTFFKLLSVGHFHPTWNWVLLFSLFEKVRIGPVVRIPRFHRGGRGSIPRCGGFVFVLPALACGVFLSITHTDHYILCLYPLLRVFPVNEMKTKGV